VKAAISIDECREWHWSEIVRLGERDDWLIAIQFADLLTHCSDLLDCFYHRWQIGPRGIPPGLAGENLRLLGLNLNGNVPAAPPGWNVGLWLILDPSRNTALGSLEPDHI
jgi:hypothetical protein